MFRTMDNIPLGEYMEVSGFDNLTKKKSQAFTEGRVVEAVQTHYERNREARDACIAHYGAKCAICGFDFQETYGDDFEGIIQVHHIVPISENGNEHVVDPINDLIPVCPNCHVALHSKSGGVYDPDELKEILRKRSHEK